MRKPILFVAMMLLAVIGCYAQYPTQFTSIVPRDFGIQGGKDGKIYQIIVKNGKSKKELVNKTTDMLSAFNLIGEKVKLDVINDKMSEYTVPFCWPSGIGVHPYDAAPVIIYGDLRFEFYDGGVKLSLENLEESFFVVHYRPTNIGEKGTENYQKYQEYLAQSRELQKTTSAAGKLFAKIDKIQEIKEISGSLTTIGKNAKSQIIKKIDEANAERLNALIKYRDRVAEQMKLSAARPASKQQNTAPRPRPVRTESSPSPSQEDLKAQELLISLFASGQIPKDMIEEKDFDDDELKSLYRELYAGASPASLPDLAPDEVSRSRYTRLLLTPTAGSTDEMIAMANDCLVRIRRVKLEKRYEELSQEISAAEGDRLSTLLKEAREISDKLKKLK